MAKRQTKRKVSTKASKKKAITKTAKQRSAEGGKEGGRPTLLDGKLIDDICSKIEKGNFVATSAALYGVPRSTLDKWIKRGSDEMSAGLETIHARFWQEIIKAEATYEDKTLAKMDKLGDASKSLAHLQWRLEKLMPKSYARKEIVKVEDNETKGGAFDANSVHQMMVDLVEEAEKGDDK